MPQMMMRKKRFRVCWRSPREVLVTFDSQDACKDDSLLFVSMHSPIIKAIVKFTEEGQMELPLGKLRLMATRDSSGSTSYSCIF